MRAQQVDHESKRQGVSGGIHVPFHYESESEKKKKTDFHLQSFPCGWHCAGSLTSSMYIVVGQ